MATLTELLTTTLEVERMRILQGQNHLYASRQAALLRRISEDETAHAEAIQALKQAVRHYGNAFKVQMATIDEQTNEIRELGTMVDDLRDDRDGWRGMRADLCEEVEALETRLREHKWLIETYRDKFAVMVEKIEELTPECEESEGYEEPQRPEDIGARHGLDVSAGLRGGGGS